MFVELVGDDQGELGAPGGGTAGRIGLPGRVRGRQPGPGAGAVEDPGGRGRARRGQPADAGVPRLGGRRGPAAAPGQPICATSTGCWPSSACAGCRTDTSATAACTSGSTSPSPGPAGTKVYREFVEQSAVLVAGYGGSMSGEHGDGRARSALLPAMYSPAAIGVFGQVKAALDPDDRLNPGVLVRPAPGGCGHPGRRRWSVGTDRFAAAVHRCTGVGKCLADTTGGLGVMCPSYQATRNEKDSTRGRARVLQEMINGEVIQLGWKSPAVHQALDLCLSCKGCARDCPTGVDMAAYKSEVLDQTYAGTLRPRSHYALGWLPRWGRLITGFAPLARLVNLLTATPGLRRLVRWSAGVDQRRHAAEVRHPAGPGSGAGRGNRTGKPVVIWVDSFSDCFTGGGVEAMVAVLERAGLRPRLLSPGRLLRADLDQHRAARGSPPAARGEPGRAAPDRRRRDPVVGLEPSCLAVWRSDAAELVGRLRGWPRWPPGILTLAELLGRDPRLAAAGPDRGRRSWPNRTATTPRCWAGRPTRRCSQPPARQVTTVGGCCGLAGNFGVEKGHYEVSVQVAEHDLLPAARAHPDAIVLADGFSCRTQLAELGRPAGDHPGGAARSTRDEPGLGSPAHPPGAGEAPDQQHAGGEHQDP